MKIAEIKTEEIEACLYAFKGPLQSTNSYSYWIPSSTADLFLLEEVEFESVVVVGFVVVVAGFVVVVVVGFVVVVVGFVVVVAGFVVVVVVGFVVVVVGFVVGLLCLFLTKMQCLTFGSNADISTLLSLLKSLKFGRVSIRSPPIV